MPSLSAALSACAHMAPARTANGSREATFIFPPSFAGFDGHFPENPVLPGIVQIMAAAYTAASGKYTRLDSIKRCKFIRPVKPEEPLHVTAQTEERAGRLHVNATLFAENEMCASLSFTLTAF